MNKIGDIIKSQRIYLGLSQQEIADYVGISKSAISRYESGEIGSMGIDKAKKMAEILRLNPLVFLSEKVQQSFVPKTPIPMIYEDVDFQLLSATRVLSANVKPFLRKNLIMMTEELPPSRKEMITWLNENIRYASSGGVNYETLTDEELREFYETSRKEMD